MDPIAHHIQQLGYHTYRITLRGHERSTEDTFRSSAWEHDLESALHDVTSKHPHLPLHIIGYSLGGLLTTRVIDQASKVTPASVILLAPALSLRAFPQVGYVLTLFPQQVWSIPNIAPRYYRRFARTPVFWYQNTFELYSKTRTLSSRTRLSKIPTLVIANPRDELVSFVGLRSWLRDNSLEESWRIEPIRPKPKNPFIPEHVIIDENSLGNSEWNNLQTLMKEFLFSTHR
jgi:alpha-beta hydrolase superfamily lysophospholipase